MTSFATHDNPWARPTRRSSSRGTVRIEVGRRNSSYLHGAGLVVILRELGIPHMRDPFHGKALAIPSDRVDDLLACLEHRHRRTVELTAAP